MLKIVYNKKKIQIFGMNMPFISSSEAKNVYFATHEIIIFASLDEINGIFIPKFEDPLNVRDPLLTIQ